MFDDEDEILVEEKILNNCKPYLNLLRTLAKNNLKRPLLRGSAQPYDRLTRLSVKPRETTMNTDLVDHGIANEWFKEEFGIAARTDTVFTTTNRGLASRYGTIHYIFPIGKFSIINSTDYADLFFQVGDVNKTKVYKKLFGGSIPKIESHKDAKQFNEYVKENEPERYRKVIEYILENGNYEKNNYQEAFKNGHEIMLKCKAYYIIRADDERVTEFINDFVWDEIFY